MSKNHHAAALGRLGGSVSSEAKTSAARENAKKGGRPIGAKDNGPRKKRKARSMGRPPSATATRSTIR